MKCKYCDNELFGGELTEYPIGICDTCANMNITKPIKLDPEVSKKQKEALDSFFSKIEL